MAIPVLSHGIGSPRVLSGAPGGFQAEEYIELSRRIFSQNVHKPIFGRVSEDSDIQR